MRKDELQVAQLVLVNATEALEKAKTESAKAALKKAKKDAAAAVKKAKTALGEAEDQAKAKAQVAAEKAQAAAKRVKAREAKKKAELRGVGAELTEAIAGDTVSRSDAVKQAQAVIEELDALRVSGSEDKVAKTGKLTSRGDAHEEALAALEEVKAALGMVETGKLTSRGDAHEEAQAVIEKAALRAEAEAATNKKIGEILGELGWRPRYEWAIESIPQATKNNRKEYLAELQRIKASWLPVIEQSIRNAEAA